MRATARVSRSPPEQPPPHFPEAREGLDRKTGRLQRQGWPSCLTFSQPPPYLSGPGAWATPRTWERPVPGTPFLIFARPVTTDIGWLSHLPSCPLGEDLTWFPQASRSLGALRAPDGGRSGDGPGPGLERGAPWLRWVVLTWAWEHRPSAWALAGGWVGEKGPPRPIVSGSSSQDF